MDNPPSDNVVPLFSPDTGKCHFHLSCDATDYAVFTLDCSFEDLLEMLFEEGADIWRVNTPDPDEEEEIILANDNDLQDPISL